MTPCSHFDCWQCNAHRETPAYKKQEADRLAQVLARKVAEEKRRSAAQGSVLGRLPAQGPKDHQKAYVGRVALEGLAARAGLTMDWNDGDPVFRELGSRTQWDDKSAGVDILREATDTIARNAATTLDEAVRKVVNATLETDLRVKEVKARQVLKANGASEDDIAAAETLLRWKPKEGEVIPFLAQPSIDITPVVNWQQKRYVQRVTDMVNARLISKTEAMRRINDNV